MAEQNERPPDPFPKSAREQLIAPDYVGAGARKILDALQNAKPRILEQPGGLNPSRVVVSAAAPILEAGRGSVVRRIRADEFSSPAVAEQAAATEGFVPNISFLLKDRSTTVDNVTVNKVLIYDGKINGQFPTGMGANNYTLTLTDPNDSLIYAGVTFNPTTLAITSRFLGVSAAATYPESRTESPTSGFIYWLIGFTFVNVTTGFKVWQARLGNINFVLIYGAANGKPALYPIDCEPGSLDLEFGP